MAAAPCCLGSLSAWPSAQAVAPSLPAPPPTPAAPSHLPALSPHRHEVPAETVFSQLFVGEMHVDPRTGVVPNFARGAVAAR